MRVDFCIALHEKKHYCFYVIVLHEIILTASLLKLPFILLYLSQKTICCSNPQTYVLMVLETEYESAAGKEIKFRLSYESEAP